MPADNWFKLIRASTSVKQLQWPAVWDNPRWPPAHFWYISLRKTCDVSGGHESGRHLSASWVCCRISRFRSRKERSWNVSAIWSTVNTAVQFIMHSATHKLPRHWMGRPRTKRIWKYTDKISELTLICIFLIYLRPLKDYSHFNQVVTLISYLASTKTGT